MTPPLYLAAIPDGMKHKVLLSLLLVFLFNCAIAGLLTLVGFSTLMENFIFSQCIGFSIHTINATTACKLAERGRGWWIMLFTFPFSVAFGVELGSLVTGIGNWGDPKSWIAVIIGLFFGGIGGITFFLIWRVGRLRHEMRERQMHSEKEQMAAQLKLLQAQIEPHFLFNTLANVSALIHSDPQQATILLDRLSDWLRLALARTRSDQSTLGDELVLLENYLQILKVRFGERLNWRIEIDDLLQTVPFPPMLLQPLLENAVRHGIEPKVVGGLIEIMATATEGGMRIELRDDGCGLSDHPSGGAGLENVRNRITALFGTAGRLTLATNAAGGVTATLELPR